MEGDKLFLSVCTPTYNRAYTLERLYKSLQEQSNLEFEWIIVDDGSTDETKTLVKSWINRGLLKIKYYYQDNQGKHVALNKGVALSTGELFTCLDSDDWFYEDTVEKVKRAWIEAKGDKNVAGIIGLDTFANGTLVGTKLPDWIKKANWIDLIFKFQVKGDKAYFFVLDKLKDYDFPQNKGNKHMPPSYQLYMLSKNYDMWLLNEALKYVEYLEDGISNNLWKKYLIAPDNYAKYRIDIMDMIPSKRRKVMNAIHLNSSLLLAEKKYKVKGIKNKLILFLTKPFGIFLYLYLMRKQKREKKR